MRAPVRKKAVKKPVTPPRNTLVISASRAPQKSSRKRSSNKNVVRGAEVSIRQAAAPGQIVYGEYKIGGVYTFLQTNRESNARVLTGTGNYQIAWIAKGRGSGGNDISITLVVSGTVSTASVSVSGKQITITAKSTNSASRSRANDIIALIKANPAASALVTCHAGEGNGTSYVQPFDETFLQDGGGVNLNHVITLAAHQLSSVDKVMFETRQVVFGYSKDPRWSIGYYSRKKANGDPDPLVFCAINPGTDDQPAQPDLAAQFPSHWTENHRQRGCAHAYLITVWDEVRFAQGNPDISFVVKGKPIFDPRTNATGYSTNAALVIADYLTNTKWGMGVPLSDIDTDALIEAADLCDQIVVLADGSQERRYVICGVFDTSQSPSETLQEMAEAIAGDIVYQGGKWRILPGAWRPVDFSLSVADSMESLTVNTKRSRADTFNSVRGTIASKDHDFKEVDFPAVTVPTYVSEDGSQIFEDLTLNFVTSNAQAQRIARIRLGQVRQAITIEGTFSL